MSAEEFYTEIIKKLQKLHSEARKAHPKDQPKMNRNDFNNYLTMKSLQMQNDEQDKDSKIRQRVNKKKKFPDDEDFSSDSESSGDRATTMFPPPTSDTTSDLNDTTIIFDQE